MTATSQTRPDYMQSDILITMGAQEESPYQSLTGLMQREISDVEKLTDNVRSLLQDCNDVLESEGLRYQVETISRCMDYYRRGILAARIMSQFGENWLQEMQSRLKVALDEQNRWDGEGGNYLSEKGRSGLEQPIDKLRKANDIVEETLQAMTSYFPKDLSVSETASSRH